MNLLKTFFLLSCFCILIAGCQSKQLKGSLDDLQNKTFQGITDIKENVKEAKENVNQKVQDIKEATSEVKKAVDQIGKASESITNVISNNNTKTTTGTETTDLNQ